MGIVTPPSKIFVSDITTAPRNRNITIGLLNANGLFTGQEFVFSETSNDFEPVGQTAYNVIGTWDASNNTPAYTTTLTTNGDALSVTVAGTTSVNNFARWNVGDLLVRDNDIFFRVPFQSDIVSNLTDNSIPMWNNNQLEDSSISEETARIQSDKSIETISGSIFFSEALAIGSAGEAFALHDVANSRRGYLIGYERLTDGSGRPFWRELEALVTDQEIQGLKNSNTGSQNVTVPITFTANRLITAVTVESTQTVSDASFSILRNGVVVEMMDNIALTADTETKIPLPQGLICSNGSTFNLQIEGVILKGTGTIGTDFQLFLKLDNHIWSRDNLLGESSLLPFLAPKLLEGTNITIDYDSNAGTITFNSAGGGGATFNPADHDVTEFRDVTSSGSGQIITTSERNNIRTDTQFYTETKSIILAGTGIQVTADDTGETLTISATTASFDAPRVENFSIDIASRVDLNTDLNVQHTITYDVIHFGSIQSMALDVVTGTDQTLTVPTQDGLGQTQSVTLAGINTSSTGTVIFKITGVDTQGNNFESNTYTVNVRTLDTHEYLYYGFSSSDNDDTIDVSTLTSREAATESFTVNFGPSTSNGQYLIILAPSDHLLNAITDSLNINQLTPPTSWVTTSNVRTINTVQYTSYVLGPLTSGYTATLTLGVD